MHQDYLLEMTKRRGGSLLHVPRTQIPSEKWPLHIYMVKLEFKFLFPKLCGFSLLGRCHPSLAE